MVAIKNIEGKELSLQFEGSTYHFPKEGVVLVEDNVCEYLKEIWPLAFEYDVKTAKNEIIPKVRVVKTKSFLSNNDDKLDMKVSRGKMLADSLGSETEGVDFYGAGIEVDSLEA